MSIIISDSSADNNYMTTEPEKLTISVTDTESVSALLYPATKKNRLGITVLLGHGAGADQMSSFMRLFAAGLADRGIDAMTFNFLYKEKGRGVPDPKPRLESCFRNVIAAARAHKKLKNNKMVVGGKSMGGRIASQVASSHEAGAGKEAVKVDALVYLGYPLHPPGKPQQMRSAHLKDTGAPMLFVQGANDAFGSEQEIKAVIKQMRLPATLYVIEGGDHSLKAPKRYGRSQEEIYRAAMDEIVRWLRELP
jgi:predicted alpha/beta-hydrolase family hydrolase